MKTRIPEHEMLEIKQRVEFYLTVHRYDAAEKLLKSSLASYGDVANLYNLLGVVYHQQAHFVEAIRAFEKALHINPHFIEATLNLAATYCDLSQYEAAQKTFQQVYKNLDTQHPLPRLTLGRLANQHAQNAHHYLINGLTQEAIQEYKRALELYGDMLDVRLQLARLYIQSEQYEKARQQLEACVKLSPQDEQAWNLYGLLLYKLGKIDSAREKWLQARSINPDDLVSHAYLKLIS